MVLTIRPRVSIPLSIVMVIFASFAFLLEYAPSAALLVKDNSVFLATRNEDGEEFFARRMKDAFVHYGLLHALPAIVWSIIMPLQYIDGVRKKWPKLHRLCGYVALSCSGILTMSGIAFIPAKLVYSKPFGAMHRPYGLPILPSMNTSLILFVAPVYFVTGGRALYLARHKRFSEHRRWAVWHGISGYVIPLQRVWLMPVKLLGFTLNNSAALRRTLGTDKLQTVEAKAEAERAAFAFSVFAACITIVAWGYTIYQRELKSFRVKAA